MSRRSELAEVVREVARLDGEWLRSPAGRDDVKCTPWMPFPMFDFIALVAEALPEAEGDMFLEVGGGIGTRSLLAQSLFGLDAYCFDRVPEYVEQARKLGLKADVADALSFAEYGKPDVVWFNRTFRDKPSQRQLEAKIWHDVRPGAVVICANLENEPPRSWWPVLDDHEVRRWIVQRPDGAGTTPLNS